MIKRLASNDASLFSDGVTPSANFRSLHLFSLAVHGVASSWSYVYLPARLCEACHSQARSVCTPARGKLLRWLRHIDFAPPQLDTTERFARKCLPLTSSRTSSFASYHTGLRLICFSGK